MRKFDREAAVEAVRAEREEAARAKARAAQEAADRLTNMQEEQEQDLQHEGAVLLLDTEILIANDDLPLDERKARIAAAQAAIDDTTAPTIPADSGTPTSTPEPTSPSVADVITIARMCKGLTKGQQAALELITLPVGETGIPVAEDGTPVELSNLRKLADKRQELLDAERAKTAKLERWRDETDRESDKLKDKLATANARIAELEKAAKAAPSSEPKPVATPTDTVDKAAAPVRKPTGSTNGRPASAGLDVYGVTSRLGSDPAPAQPAQNPPAPVEEHKSPAEKIRGAVTSVLTHNRGQR